MIAAKNVMFLSKCLSGTSNIHTNNTSIKVYYIHNEYSQDEYYSTSGDRRNIKKCEKQIQFIAESIRERFEREEKDNLIKELSEGYKVRKGGHRNLS